MRKRGWKEDRKRKKTRGWEGIEGGKDREKLHNCVVSQLTWFGRKSKKLFPSFQWLINT